MSPSRSSSSTQLYMIGRLFRRRRQGNRVQTLEEQEQQTTTEKKQVPRREPQYRLILYSTEWQPNIVARILAKTIPQIDRRFGFDLCTRARSAGNAGVTVVITTQKQAEIYLLLLRREGLPVTIEPYDVER